MMAACMNAVRIEDGQWVGCRWIGEVATLDVECPRCLNKGRLAPVVTVGGVDPGNDKPTANETLVEAK